MVSIDTNLLLYAVNEDAPEHGPAYRWLLSLGGTEKVVISEFVLAELYGLLRNPRVLRRPLGAKDATEVIETYRRHPRWGLVGFPLDSRPLHDALWQRARQQGFAFRRLYDVRTALTLVAHGVTDFATTNTKDFAGLGLGFARVWNPLVPAG